MGDATSCFLLGSMGAHQYLWCLKYVRWRHFLLLVLIGSREPPGIGLPWALSPAVPTHQIEPTNDLLDSFWSVSAQRRSCYCSWCSSFSYLVWPGWGSITVNYRITGLRWSYFASFGRFGYYWLVSFHWRGRKRSRPAVALLHQRLPLKCWDCCNHPGMSYVSTMKIQPQLLGYLQRLHIDLDLHLIHRVSGFG